MLAEYFRCDHILKCHANNLFRQLMSIAIAVLFHIQICRLSKFATNPERLSQKTDHHVGWHKQKKLVRNLLLKSSYTVAMTSLSCEPRIVASVVVALCCKIQNPSSDTDSNGSLKKLENIPKLYNTSSQLIVVCQY